MKDRSQIVRDALAGLPALLLGVVGLLALVHGLALAWNR